VRLLTGTAVLAKREGKIIFASTAVLTRVVLTTLALRAPSASLAVSRLAKTAALNLHPTGPSFESRASGDFVVTDGLAKRRGRLLF
jgi:hypothetical protein